jgi:hypothetical protein
LIFLNNIKISLIKMGRGDLGNCFPGFISVYATLTFIWFYIGTADNKNKCYASSSSFYPLQDSDAS